MNVSVKCMDDALDFHHYLFANFVDFYYNSLSVFVFNSFFDSAFFLSFVRSFVRCMDSILFLTKE